MDSYTRGTILMDQHYDAWKTRAPEEVEAPDLGPAELDKAQARAEELAGEAFDNMMPRAERFLARQSVETLAAIARVAARNSAGLAGYQVVDAALAPLRTAFVAANWDEPEFLDTATAEIVEALRLEADV